MSSKPYSLEVYEPGSHKNCWMSFTSDAPFMAINKGDIIDPNVWPDSQSPAKVLRATEIHHVIWEGDGASRHKVMVFTEEIDA